MVISPLFSGSAQTYFRGTPVGNNASLPSTKSVDPGGPITYVLEDAILPKGYVVSFSAFFTLLQTIRFQIWRPVNESMLMFKLVREIQYTITKFQARTDVRSFYHLTLQ